MECGNLKRFAIYSRKSRFTGKGESIGNQIELCRRFIALHYSESAAAQALVYEDEGFSGGNLERPQFRKMMRDASAGHFDAVVVYRLDRISRNIGDFASLIEQFAQRKIAFLSIREQFDTASPMGRAMMYIASVFSQLERETIAERIRDNLHELAKTGRWLGGITPLGYESESVTRVNVDGKSRKSHRLRTVPAEKEIVCRIFSVFLSEGSLKRSVQALHACKMTTRRGAEFTGIALKGILNNPVYMTADRAAYEYLSELGCDISAQRKDFDGTHGVMVYNRTWQRTGKAHVIRPPEEWIVSVGEHAGFVSGEEWIRAQRILARNRTGVRTPPRHTALLSGILYCGSCGARMRVKMRETMNDYGERNFRYICTGKEKSHGNTCAMKSADGNVLDNEIWNALKCLPYDKEEWNRKIKHLVKRYETESEAPDKEELASRITACEKEIHSLLDTLTRAAGTESEAYILRRIEELHREWEALRMRKERRAKETLSEMSDTDIQRLVRWDCISDEMSPAEKRAAVRTLVQRVIWGGEQVHIYWLGSGEVSAVNSCQEKPPVL